jgi:hypothetical protein
MTRGAYVVEQDRIVGLTAKTPGGLLAVRAVGRGESGVPRWPRRSVVTKRKT